MLERGLAARYAAPVFYRNINDFDVYIEDTAPGYEKIFANLLGRAISAKFSINRVFPLGSRHEVISAAKHDLITKPRRHAVFVVDGDLYMLCGERALNPHNVIVLPRYCIENFLWDEAALVALMDEEEPLLNKQTLQSRLDLLGWINRSGPALKPLFVIFAVAQALNSGIITVARGSKSICASHDGEVCHIKSTAIVDEIYTKLVRKEGVVKVEYMINLVNQKIEADRCFVTTYVSSKDFTLPLLIQRIRHITKSKTPNINLKLRLSKLANVTPLAGPVQKISEIVEVLKPM